LPGVEIPAEEIPVSAQQMPEQTCLAPQPAHSATSGAQFELAITAQPAPGAYGHIPQEEEGRPARGPTQQTPVTAALHVDVEGYRFVFGLFQCVPAPQAAHFRVCIRQPMRVAQYGIGHDRGEMLQGDGGGQLPFGGKVLVDPADALPDRTLQGIDVITQVPQPLVVLDMLAAVVGLLADETADLLCQ